MYLLHIFGIVLLFSTLPASFAQSSGAFSLLCWCIVGLYRSIYSYGAKCYILRYQNTMPGACFVVVFQ